MNFVVSAHAPAFTFRYTLIAYVLVLETAGSNRYRQGQGISPRARSGLLGLRVSDHDGRGPGFGLS